MQSYNNFSYLFQKMFKKAVPLAERFALPEKWKGGRIEKYVNYWKSVATDYSEATQDIIKGAKNKPLKATIYSTTALSLFYLSKTKPNEHNFRDAYVRMHHELTLLPESIKNPKSQIQRDLVTRCENEGTLRFTNLGIATLVWRDNYDSKVGLFSAQCEYLQPSYKEIVTDRVVDFGINNRWTVLEKSMKDFDINSEEWDERGRPVNPGDQLKPMF